MRAVLFDLDSGLVASAAAVESAVVAALQQQAIERRLVLSLERTALQIRAELIERVGT
jgi:beta-phosphoglucomutase-like phosphatase (HAD superfamily)